MQKPEQVEMLSLHEHMICIHCRKLPRGRSGSTWLFKFLETFGPTLHATNSDQDRRCDGLPRSLVSSAYLQMSVDQASGARLLHTLFIGSVFNRHLP